MNYLKPVSFETAVIAKRCGFNLVTKNAYWKNIKGKYFLCPDVNECNSDLMYCNYSAPIQALLQTWLRERNIDIIVKPWTGNTQSEKTYAADVCIFGTKIYKKLQRVSTYEDALELGLLEAITLYEKSKDI